MMTTDFNMTILSPSDTGGTMPNSERAAMPDGDGDELRERVHDGAGGEVRDPVHDQVRREVFVRVRKCKSILIYRF